MSETAKAPQVVDDGEHLNELAKIRADVLRELCEQLNLWDQDCLIANEDDLAEHFLMPVVNTALRRLADVHGKRLDDLADMQMASSLAWKASRDGVDDVADQAYYDGRAHAAAECAMQLRLAVR